jgi:hypothetical protein
LNKPFSSYSSWGRKNRGKETNILMSLTDFKVKMNKSKINKYKINNNNKANTKHEFNVKYERYKQDISKDRKLCFGKKYNTIQRPIW